MLPKIRTKTASILKISNGFLTNEHISLDSDRFYIKYQDFSDFVSVFNGFVLEAQTELCNKLGYYEYLLVLKRSFPGCFVGNRSDTHPTPVVKIDEFS